MDMHSPIEAADGILDVSKVKPVHVALINAENPDEFEMGFYAMPLPPTWETNERASMIARAIADRTGHDAPEFGGDIVLRCDKVLADRIIENDQRHQQDDKTVKEFRYWMRDYADANGLEVDDVFHSVARYAGHVLCEADAAAEAEMQQALAKMMGIHPDQVGIIRL